MPNYTGTNTLFSPSSNNTENELSSIHLILLIIYLINFETLL